MVLVTTKWKWDENALNWGIGAYVCSYCNGNNLNLPREKKPDSLVASFSAANYCPHCGREMKEYIDCCTIGELMDID